MQRTALEKLITWQQKKSRKPLILKGARQVGKTHLLQRFGEQHYPAYHYFNFEREPRLASLFEESLDPMRIIEALVFSQKRPIDYEKDLIIFDEIQACPRALTSLKYFCEELPQAQICAAGSLLGIYLGPVSYPVGKVEHLEMHPMSFMEYLMAIKDDLSVDLLHDVHKKKRIASTAHDHLWDQLKTYFIVGGLPEVVDIYRSQQEDKFMAFNAARGKQQDLIDDYFSDIAKHSGKINAMHINRVWRSVPEQLARSQDASAKKFRFKDVIPGVDRFSKMASAIDWLESAGLILKTPIVNTVRLPLKVYAQENTFKLFMFDVGILGALGGLSPETILKYQYGSYKGFFTENFVAQAFSYKKMALHSWTEGTAEIEFLREIGEHVIPVEVKSGWVTQAKSLQVFAKKYQPPYQVILSGKPLNIDLRSDTRMIPLYLAELLEEVLSGSISLG